MSSSNDDTEERTACRRNSGLSTLAVGKVDDASEAAPVRSSNATREEEWENVDRFIYKSVHNVDSCTCVIPVDDAMCLLQSDVGTARQPRAAGSNQSQ